MYRLVLYYLIFLLAAAMVLGFFGILPYNPISILSSTLVLVAAGWISNRIIAAILNVPTNIESSYITALILALIITPPQTHLPAVSLPFLLWASVWANASKYIINFKNKHIFNPAAFAVALTALTLNQSASWWVGTAVMLPFTLIGGILMIRKVRRWDAVIGFIAAAVLTMLVLTIGHGSIVVTMQRAILASPLVFFAAVMLTEPLTMPPTRDGRIAYGILVGWLFAPQTHIASLSFTPELALLAGNIFSYAISPKERYTLKLKEIQQSAAGVLDFVFSTPRQLQFAPGQYMEWTLGHNRPDNRGNRRYLTIASSPTEQDVRIGVKFYENPSSFKQRLAKLKPGDEIIASQLAGDFVLPEDQKEKLVFIAGGIGVTPFRSMIKDLLDRKEQRDIVVFYSNRTADEIAYTDVFDEASRQLGIKTVYTLTDRNSIPAGWHGDIGYFTSEKIIRHVPDYTERTFYISGSHIMVEAFKEQLLAMGVGRTKIVTDFFPGLA